MSDIVKVCKIHGYLNKNDLNKRSKCRKCTATSSREWRKNNPEKCRLTKAKQREKTREKIKIRARLRYQTIEKVRTQNRDGYLKRTYGITLEIYQSMLVEQDHKCAICDRYEIEVECRSGFIRNLAVDHDHKNNKVRGLLCRKCNSALGHADDSIPHLEKMIEYLKKHK